ncbi:MAG: SpoIIE family protein phosphatase [Myxococcales bacterium]|nr:SpoIIE family protein phosphatase [Myxococcales bacterium]
MSQAVVAPDAETPRAPAPRRRSLSVLTKMILYAAALVAVVVAAVSTLDLVELLRTYDERAKAQEKLGTAAIQREGQATARGMAVSLAPALGEFNTSLIGEVVQSTTRDNRYVLRVLVAETVETPGKVVAQSGFADPPKTVKLLSKGQKPAEPKEIKTSKGRALLLAVPIIYGGKRVGEVRVAYSLNELDKQLARIQSQRAKAKQSGILRSGLVGLLCVLFGLVLAIGQGLQVSRPVRALAHGATAIAEGNLGARVEVKSRDEFGALGATFNFMAERIQVLLRETADKVTLQNEMEIARNVQDLLVAPPKLVRHGDLSLAGFYQPASFCGGDFWNYFNIDETKTLLVIGDVTGHGVSSAMLTATAKSCCDTLQATLGSSLDILQLMKTLNFVIFQAAKRHLQMTCFITLFDQAERKIVYASAGHPMPYLCRKMDDGRYDIRTLIARGNRLGDLLEWDFPAYTMDLQRGDVLLFFTDGITEGENPLGEQWGEKRLRRAFHRNAALAPDELRDLLVKNAFEFYRGTAPDDDLTVVVARAE